MQDIDVVVFRYRKAYYRDRGVPKNEIQAQSTAQDVTEPIVAKNRQGTLETASITFDPEQQHFTMADRK